MDGRICIVFIAGGLGLGGAEQQLYHVLCALDRTRFRPIVITLGTNLDEFWYEPISSLGVTVYHVSRRFGRVMRAMEIGKLLRAEMADIVHSWHFHANPYAAVAGRLAATPIKFGSMRENYKLLADYKFIRSIGYFGLDCITTNSVTATKQVKQLKLTRAKVCTVPNGVVIPAPINQTEKECRRLELGCSSEDLVIGTIGRIDRDKNHQMLLRVFARLLSDWPSLKLVIIGDGPLKDQLQDLAKELRIDGKVRLPGTVPFAARLLSAMDVCCMTSYTEGMPNVVMEAAAAGVPVVSTNCGDSYRLIENGVSGFVVPLDGSEEMVDCLHRLLGNPEQRVHMGRVGREKMQREYDVVSMVNRFSAVYEKALGEKHASLRGMQ